MQDALAAGRALQEQQPLAWTVSLIEVESTLQ